MKFRVCYAFLQLIPTVFVISLVNRSIARPIPAEVLFSKSEMASPKLSHDGKYVAYLSANEDRLLAINLLNTETGEHQYFKPEDNNEVSSIQWVNSRWLVFTLISNKQAWGGTFALDVTDPKNLAVLQLRDYARVVDTIPGSENEIWLHNTYWSIGASDFKHFDELSRYNLQEISPKKGGIVTTFASRGKVVESVKSPRSKQSFQWITNRRSEPAIAMLMDNFDSKVEYSRYDYANGNWEKMDLDPEDWDLHAFIDDEHIAISGFDSGSYKKVYSYNINEHRIDGVLFEDDSCDIDPTLRFLRTPDGMKLVGCTYQSDHLVTQWLDPQLKSIQTSINQTFKDTSNTIYGYSDDLKKVIVVTESPVSPNCFFLCDIEKGKIQQLSDPKHPIHQQPYSPVFKFQYKTPDDNKLTAYLSKPALKTPDQPAPPLVVLIHGGPWSRDTWEFNRQVQFLASRGYAVLQVNFRGSTGYGSKISADEAYKFEKMVEDIQQCIDLVAKQKLIDPERIALMGGSFGAYATIFLAAKDPERYKAAIAIAGIYDFEEHIEDLRKDTINGRRYDGQYHFLTQHLGDPDLDSTYLRSISPIHIADQIRCPTMVVHGADDRVISYHQSKDLIRILKNSGIPLDFYFEYDEGHGFQKEENAIEFFQKVESFLETYMPSGIQS